MSESEEPSAPSESEQVGESEQDSTVTYTVATFAISADSEWRCTESVPELETRFLGQMLLGDAQPNEKGTQLTGSENNNG